LAPVLSASLASLLQGHWQARVPWPELLARLACVPERPQASLQAGPQFLEPPQAHPEQPKALPQVSSARLSRRHL